MSDSFAGSCSRWPLGLELSTATRDGNDRPLPLEWGFELPELPGNLPVRRRGKKLPGQAFQSGELSLILDVFFFYDSEGLMFHRALLSIGRPHQPPSEKHGSFAGLLVRHPMGRAVVS